MDAQILSRWLAPAVVAVGVGITALAPLPAHARHDDDLVRVLVDVADVVLRGGVPYYRHGDYRHDDRLIVIRDRHGRPRYYRQLPRHYYRDLRDHDFARGYGRQLKCNRNGRCQLTYYDPRYDRDGRYGRHGGYDGYDRYYRYDRPRWRDGGD